MSPQQLEGPTLRPRCRAKRAGRTTGVSPQQLKAEDLRAIFDKFAGDQSTVGTDELAAAMRALGVGLPDVEIRELVMEARPSVRNFYRNADGARTERER